MKKIKAVLNAMAVFISVTHTLLNSNSDLCNDLLLVYARNVELTSTKPGQQPHVKLDRTKITLIGRNKDHCSRIMRHMVRGIRSKEYHDERFVNDYDTEYVFIDDKNNAITSFWNKLMRERSNHSPNE